MYNMNWSTFKEEFFATQLNARYVSETAGVAVDLEDFAVAKLWFSGFLPPSLQAMPGVGSGN